MELKYPLWFLEIDEYEIPHIVNKGITTKMLCLYVILMCFILAWVEWKGVAHDAHIFLKALRRPRLGFSHPLRGLRMKLSQLFL